MNTEMNQKKQRERERENIIIKYTNPNGVNVCHYCRSTGEGHPAQPKRDGIH